MEDGVSFKDFCVNNFRSASKAQIIDVSSDLLEKARQKIEGLTELNRIQGETIEALTLELEEARKMGRDSGKTNAPQLGTDDDDDKHSSGTATLITGNVTSGVGRSHEETMTKVDPKQGSSQEKDPDSSGSNPVDLNLPGNNYNQASSSARPTVPSTTSTSAAGNQHRQLFQDVYNESSDHSVTTVFCLGLGKSASLEDLYQMFHGFGSIVTMNVVSARGLGFVRFSSKEEARNAIIGTRDVEHRGRRIYSKWARTNTEVGNVQFRKTMI